MKNPAKEKLVKEWLFFARENFLFARAGMKEDFSPYRTNGDLNENNEQSKTSKK